MQKVKRNKAKMNILAWVLLVLLICYAISLIYTLVWGVMASLKDDVAYMTSKAKVIPDNIYFGNYELAWANLFVPVQVDGLSAKLYIDGMLMNTLVYAIGCSLFATISPCVMSYLCAKYPCKFSTLCYNIVVVTMTIPIVGALPSQMSIVNGLGLKDTFGGMFIMSGSFTGLYFLVFYATFKGLPSDYMEAAQIDGAGHFKIFFRIMFPLTLTTFLTVFIIYFIQFWNNYTTPMLFMPNKPTLSYGIYYFSVLNKTNSICSDQIQIAAAMIVLLPILVVFLSMHKTLMGNLTAGGIKG
ncbi:MAG: carbohydrate ABC transporter permease [Alphaproteobacteria bacterium]|nr:carbohydrate ABC transporter permease [Alphaproteobacteria bacterium]